jgi:hypothetical protein
MFECAVVFSIPSPVEEKRWETITGLGDAAVNIVVAVPKFTSERTVVAKESDCGVLVGRSRRSVTFGPFATFSAP